VLGLIRKGRRKQMTKERRLAIKMWEQIVRALEHDPPYNLRVFDIGSFKREFCYEHNLDWKNGCWFCQYVRKDWRPDIPSRWDIPVHSNCCQLCPLYKEHEDILDYDECGCTNDKETLWMRVYRDGDVEAAKRILELLRGNK
jgi:hypothetical protein